MRIKVKKLSEVEGKKIDDGINVSKVTKRVVIGKDEGAENFYMRVFTLEPGGFTPKHSHEWEHEVFILNGKCTLYTESEEILLEKLTAVFVPGNELHQFKNVSKDEPLEFICIIPNWGQ